MNRKSEGLLLWLTVVSLSGLLLVGALAFAANAMGLLGPAGASCADVRTLLAHCLPIH